MKPVLPKFGSSYSAAVAVLNRRSDGTPSEVAVPLRELGLDSDVGYNVRDLYDGRDLGLLLPAQVIRVDVNPSGASFLGVFFLPQFQRNGPS